MSELAVELAPAREMGLRLEHPILVAAGGAGFGSELLDAVEGRLPGAIVTRGVTMAAQRGAPAPRMTPLADGLLHAIGHPNPGLERVLERHAARWASAEVPVIVSVRADSAEGFGEMARALDLRPGVAGIELDLGAHDRARDGRPFGLGAGTAEAATVAARAATELPLLVKLVPTAPDIREVARAVAAAGADAIVACGPLTGLALDRSDGRAGATTRPALGSAYGGLSGPALKPIALRIVYEIAQVVRIPIVGTGGIATVDDVLDHLAAGASAVGLATAVLTDPSLPGRLASELDDHLERASVASVDDLVGTALPRRRDRGSLRA